MKQIWKNLFCALLACLLAASAAVTFPAAGEGGSSLLLTRLNEDRITYSADIFPEKDQTIRKNSNGFGGALCVAGVKFTEGFFTHASNAGDPTQITFDLSGLGYKYFGVRVGVDDAQGQNGTCRFYIIGDGELLCQTSVLRNTDTFPQPLYCNVEGVSALTLRVDNGGDNYASDWGVWGEPTLYRCAEDMPVYPEIAFSSPSPGAIVTNGLVTVTGFCRGGDAVRLSCGGESVTVTPREDTFTHTFILSKLGKHSITARLSGKGQEIASCETTITYKKGDTMLLTQLDESRITYSKDIFDVRDQTIRKNSNDAGGKLCVAGVTFDEGFFTHASNTKDPTQITFDLSGLDYRYIGVRVGIDDAQGQNGSCRFYIFGDGNLLCKTPVLFNTDSSPVFLSCDIQGIKQLILRVDNGGDGYNSDWGVWGEPTLYRSREDVPVYPEIRLTAPVTGKLITDGRVSVTGYCRGGDAVWLSCGDNTVTLPVQSGTFSHDFTLTEYGTFPVSAVLFADEQEVARCETSVTHARDEGIRFEVSNGDTSAQIGICAGNPTLFSIRNLRTGREWLSDPGIMPLPVSVDGQAASWTYTGSREGTDGAYRTLTLSFSCDHAGLTADSVWTFGEGGGIRHSIRLHNPGARDIPMTYAPTFTGILGGELTLFTVARGGGTPGDEGTWNDEVSDGSVFRVSDSRVPIVFLSDGNERIAVAHTFGTGELVVSGIPGGARVESGLGSNFRTDIPAGEALLIPASFFLTGSGTQDEFSNYLNDWLYTYNTPSVIKKKTWPHVMFNMWNSLGGADPRSNNFRRTCDAAVELGFDRIVLDYGWWDKLGEWDPSPEKWKNGMEPYGKYAKELGLEYVMYFLFHNGNSEQEGALSALTHPEWFIGDGAIDEICDLGNRECVDYIKKTLASKLNEFHIPGYRSDFSPVALSSNKINRHKYGVDTAYWNYIGFYEILDYLKENVPGFTYENCCGGGYYKDYATMSYTSNIFSTDTYRVIDARRTFYDTSFCHPACQIAPQISFSDANPAIWDSFALRKQMTYGYIYRSVMLGAMYVNLDSPVYRMNREESAFLARQIQIYKQWIRPLVVNAELYHTTDRPDNIHWDATQYYDPATGKGILYVFRPDNDITSETFRLYGLDPDAFYYVRSEENKKTARFSGTELMENGITVSCDRIYWSDLLYIQRTDVPVDASNIAWENEMLPLEGGGTATDTSSEPETTDTDETVEPDYTPATQTTTPTGTDTGRHGCASTVGGSLMGSAAVAGVAALAACAASTKKRKSKRDR